MTDTPTLICPECSSDNTITKPLGGKPFYGCHDCGHAWKGCPKCGSIDTTVMTQTDNGEVVCAADVCQVCGHQWNVG